ncbi:ABC transporter permease [Telmatobacter bradus]|uniref:ABC transporter permease n=1 Tax=Telmatobacter bradus TaxID=474953 RepID=UPI003B4345FA
MLKDLQYAWRQLRKSPGFSLTVILTLALSVGLSTAVFCVIDTVILRPLSFDHPERIVAIQSYSRSGYTQPASWPSYRDERTQVKTFSAFAAYSDYFKMTLETPQSGPVQIKMVHSTDNLFNVFGVHPILGRTYLPGEEADGKNQVAVLAYETWQRYFGADRNVLGRQIKLDGIAYTVIGVMPAGFRFPLGMENAIFTPRLIDKSWMNNRGSHWLRTVARLRDGVTMEQAQADLTQVFANLGKAYPDSDEGRKAKPQPLAEAILGQSKGPLWTLLGAVLVVLAIGCVNVAGLLLARGVRREREMAMRVAIGAGRMRLVRQVLTESLLLSLLGVLASVVLAEALLHGLRIFLISALARGAEIQMNWTVFCVTIATSVAASLLASLYPALRMSGADPNRVLKAGGAAGSSRGQHRIRAGFVIVQVSLTLVLLIVSSLLIRMVSHYRHADLGFDSAHIMSMPINLTPTRYAGRDALAGFYTPLASRIHQIPGVQAVGAISLLPIESWGNNSEEHIAGQPPYPRGQERLAEIRTVTAGYYDVFGIALHRGRSLSATLDGPENTALPVVVNEAFVRKFIPNGLDPVAQHLDSSDKPAEWPRIVGVTSNVRQDIYAEPLAEVNWLIDSVPVKERADTLNGMSLVIRYQGDPNAIIPSVREALHEVDPTVPFKTPTTMSEVLDKTLVMERMESLLFAIFASLALVLALVGIYGLISHEVDQETREIGIRMALGAARERVLRMVLTRVAWMLTLGAAQGLALTWVVRKLIGVVIHVDPQKDYGFILASALSVVLSGLLVALIPGLRAAAIEPMQALRSE